VLCKELLHSVLFDFSVRLFVYFVADEDEREYLRLLWVSLIEELTDPLFDVIERLSSAAITFFDVIS
jgi:hypothetical protein